MQSTVLNQCLPNRIDPSAIDVCQKSLLTLKTEQSKSEGIFTELINGFEEVKKIANETKELATKSIAATTKLLEDVHQHILLGKGNLTAMQSVFTKQDSNEGLEMLFHDAIEVLKHVKSGKLTDQGMHMKFERLSWYCSENVTDKKFFDEKNDYVEYTDVKNVGDGSSSEVKRWYQLITGHFGKVAEPEDNVAIYEEHVREEALYWFMNLGWTLSPHLHELGPAFEKVWKTVDPLQIYRFLLYAAQSRSVILSDGSVKRSEPNDPSWTMRNAYVQEMLNKVKRTSDDTMKLVYIEIWLRSMNHTNLEALVEFANGKFSNVIKLAQYIPSTNNPTSGSTTTTTTTSSTLNTYTSTSTTAPPKNDSPKRTSPSSSITKSDSPKSDTEKTEPAKKGKVKKDKPVNKLSPEEQEKAKKARLKKLQNEEATSAIEAARQAAIEKERKRREEDAQKAEEERLKNLKTDKDNRDLNKKNRKERKKQELAEGRKPKRNKNPNSGKFQQPKVQVHVSEVSPRSDKYKKSKGDGAKSGRDGSGAKGKDLSHKQAGSVSDSTTDTLPTVEPGCKGDILEHSMEASELVKRFPESDYEKYRSMAYSLGNEYAIQQMKGALDEIEAAVEAASSSSSSSSSPTSTTSSNSSPTSAPSPTEPNSQQGSRDVSPLENIPSANLNGFVPANEQQNKKKKKKKNRKNKNKKGFHPDELQLILQNSPAPTSQSVYQEEPGKEQEQDQDDDDDEYLRFMTDEAIRKSQNPEESGKEQD